MRASLLILADGRFPAGGHAHSGSLEASVAAGRVTDVDSLGAFLTGRLNTTGLVTAGLAAAASTLTHDWEDLDVETDARTPSPAQRDASRRQGRALLRAAVQAWPDPIFDALGRHTASPHHAVALGATAAAAGLGREDAALAAAHGSIAGPASAAVRLLALDPMMVSGLLAALAPSVDTVAQRAASTAHGPLSRLPADSAPLLDIGAEWHSSWEVRLFAS
jgi:urease accessory protein